MVARSHYLSLRKQGCKSASYAIYTLYYTQKLTSNKNLPPRLQILGGDFVQSNSIREKK